MLILARGRLWVSEIEAGTASIDDIAGSERNCSSGICQYDDFARLSWRRRLVRAALRGTTARTERRRRRCRRPVAWPFSIHSLDWRNYIKAHTPASNKKQFMVGSVECVIKWPIRLHLCNVCHYSRLSSESYWRRQTRLERRRLSQLHFQLYFEITRTVTRPRKRGLSNA